MTSGEIILAAFMTFWSAGMSALVWSTSRKLEQRLEHRIDRLEQRMDAQFGRVDDRFGGVDDRFGRIDSGIDDGFGRVEDRFGGLESQLAGLRADLTQIALAVGAGGPWRASEG